MSTVWTNGMPNGFGCDRYGDSPYYSPPEGMSILIDRDFADAYEFDQVVIWRDEATGELFGAYDSGCSCPTPFGDLTREGMAPIRRVEDMDHLIAAATQYRSNPQFVAELKAAVREALA